MDKMEHLELIEAKKMIGRVRLFEWIHKFSNEFMKEFNQLEEIVNSYESGNSSIIEVRNLFDAFTKKYTAYIKVMQEETRVVNEYKRVMIRFKIWNSRDNNDAEFAADCKTVESYIKEHEPGNTESLEKIKNEFEAFKQKHKAYINKLKEKFLF